MYTIIFYLGLSRASHRESGTHCSDSSVNTVQFCDCFSTNYFLRLDENHTKVVPRSLQERISEYDCILEGKILELLEMDGSSH